MEDKIILSCPVSRATIERIIKDSLYHKIREMDKLTIGVVRKITDYEEIREGVRSHTLIKNGVFNFLPAVFYTIGQHITFKPLFTPVIPIESRDKLTQRLLSEPRGEQTHVNFLDIARRYEIAESVSMRKPDYSLVLDGIAIDTMGLGETPSLISGRVPAWLTDELNTIVPMDVWTNVGHAKL